MLDRLVGYRISPILWRRVRPGLSAGRVQSVAVRLIVEREREIRAFVPVEYWSVDVRLTPEGDEQPFLARLVEIPEGKLAASPDKKGVAPRRGGRGRAARRAPEPRRATAWRTSSARSASARRRRRSRPRRCSRRPRASSGSARARRCRSPSACTRASTSPARAAVGLITYMRTDSVNIAETALREIAELVQDRVRPGVRARRAAALQDAVAERAGGARGDPPDVGAADARARRGVARPRPAPAVHDDLAAHGRDPDGRGALQPGRRRHRGARTTGSATACARPARRSCSTGSSASTRRGATRGPTRTPRRRCPSSRPSSSCGCSRSCPSSTSRSRRRGSRRPRS